MDRVFRACAGHFSLFGIITFSVPHLMCMSLFCLCCDGMGLTPLLYLSVADGDLLPVAQEWCVETNSPNWLKDGTFWPRGTKITIDVDLALPFL